MSLSREQEQMREIATNIFNELQAQRGMAGLEGFYDGEVIYPEQERRIYVSRLGIYADFERDIWRARDFSREDIGSGITAIRDHKFLNPDWPKVPFKKEPELRYIAIAGTGKTMQGNLEQPFHPAELDLIHMDAIQRVATLSSIPFNILEIFGTYEEFNRVLGYPDLKGIDTTESNPIQIIYQGGLRVFIHALELNERGEIDRLDTSFWKIRDTLDHRDHFTKLLETLEKAKA